MYLGWTWLLLVCSLLHFDEPSISITTGLSYRMSKFGEKHRFLGAEASQMSLDSTWPP